MNATPCLFLLFVLSTVQAQTPPPTVSKDCKGLSARARTECLKVAGQMEKEAAKPHDPASTDPAPSGPGAQTVHHSSPIMQTPEEKKAASKPTPPK
jgi:hypothetical protein